jgi:hypothetical protein
LRRKVPPKINDVLALMLADLNVNGRVTVDSPQIRDDGGDAEQPDGLAILSVCGYFHGADPLLLILKYERRPGRGGVLVYAVADCRCAAGLRVGLLRCSRSRSHASTPARE